MQIVIAPDSFKGSLSALEAANAIARGVLKVFTHAVIDEIPMADGGEGTVEALVAATHGHIVEAIVQNPLGIPITAEWGMLGNGHSAVVAMANASGLPLLIKEQQNPMITTTYGTGQLIHHALAALHAKDIAHPTCKETKPTLIIGIGGSATNDGGVGALQALGVRFLDENGKDIGNGGGELGRIASICTNNINPLIARTNIVVACDVTNPLCGEFGASAIFGPQKGATPEMVAQLDANLAHFGAVSKKHTGRDVANVQGAGAAGGLGAGLLFFTGAKLQPGVRIVQETTDFAKRVQRADIIFTGEGQTDAQTAFGKVPVGVAHVAKQYNKPVICLSGALTGNIDALHHNGLTALFSAVTEPCTVGHCMANAAQSLTVAAEEICRAIAIGKKLA